MQYLLERTLILGFCSGSAIGYFAMAKHRPHLLSPSPHYICVVFGVGGMVTTNLQENTVDLLSVKASLLLHTHSC